MFMSSSLIYIFIMCSLKSSFYFIYLYFFHICSYLFCLSVSRNIHVDSIKLLSTLATDSVMIEFEFYEHYFVMGFYL